MTEKKKKEYRWKTGTGYYEAKFVLSADRLCEAYFDNGDLRRYVKLAELPTKVGALEEVQVRSYLASYAYTVASSWDGRLLTIGCRMFKGARAKQIIEMVKAAKRRW